MSRRVFFVLLFIVGLVSFFVTNNSIVIDARGSRPGVVPTYRLTDLGVINTQGNMMSYPTGINQAGAVTGYSRSGTSFHAARFINGVAEDLGTIPGGETSTGWGINNLGHVTGDSEYSVNGGSIRHAAVWRNGSILDLGYLPLFGNYSRGNGINDHGDVVGHSGPSLSTLSTRAFIWDAVAGMRDLGTLGGQYSRANSINNSRMVTGWADRNTGFGLYRAFIWDSINGMRDIGTIAGDTAVGNSINANGHVAGTSTINGFDNRQHAFLYDGTMIRDLGAIGDNDFLSDRSTGNGINIHDHVVGSTYKPYEGGALHQIAFVYRDGQMYDLQTLLDSSGNDYRLYTATAINDAGQIAVETIKISTNQIRAVLLTPNISAETSFDFDGDGKTDIGIFRPSVAEWWYQRSNNGQVAAFQFGTSTDKLAPADFTGDGKTDIAVWRPATGEWHVLRSEDNSYYAFPFGTNDDIPAPADYDGDATADAAVFRPSNGTWYISRSRGGTTFTAWGTNGDIPVVSDYDADGKADIAVYRPGPGEWWLNRSTAGVIGLQFGTATDKPVQGDYTGDGKADVAYWRPSTGFWFVLRSEDFSFFSFPFGTTGDTPAPGDYDGDGRYDATVFRGSNATWYSQRTTAGTLIQQFGSSGDRPIPNAFVP